MMRKLQELEERFNDSNFDTVLEEDNPWEENENIVEKDFMGVSGKKVVPQRVEIDHEQKIIVNFEKEKWRRADIGQVDFKTGEESQIEDCDKSYDQELSNKDDNATDQNMVSDNHGQKKVDTHKTYSDQTAGNQNTKKNKLEPGDIKIQVNDVKH